MAIKKRNQQTVNSISSEDAERLANELSDKPYGQHKKTVKAEQVANTEQDTAQLRRTTISLPQAMLEKVEDMAISNKRSGKELNSVSAIIREALKEYCNV